MSDSTRSDAASAGNVASPPPGATRRATAQDRAAQAALFDACFQRGDGGVVLPWRYDAAPHGAGLVRVVDGPAGLVAGYACSPRVLVTPDGPVTVGQTGDVMTLPSERGKGLFSALDRAVLEDARAAGWPVVYGLPNASSAHIFTRDLGWLEVGRVRPWTFVLASDAGARAERMRVGRAAAALVPWSYWRGTMRMGHMKDLFFAKANVVAIARFKPEVDSVTEEAARGAQWAVRRDHAFLNWRFCDAPSQRFKAHGVFEPSGRMRGYAVVQLPARGAPVGYVADIVALDRIAFAAAMEAALSHLRKAGASVARAYAIDGSRWQQDLVWSGFRPPKAGDSKPVIARVLDERHPLAAVARDASRWAFTDADRDAELISMKHRLKRALRGAYAWVLWHTGLARLVDRCSAPRLTILYGHCVADDAINGELAPEMKVSERRLERLLRALGRRFDLVTIDEGMTRLTDGTATRSMVALSMDDGYRDNLVRLVPLLERTGARATVFLEAGPVVERRPGWLHTFEWLAKRLEHVELRDRIAALAKFDAHCEQVRAAGDTHALKRALKYALRPDMRDGALTALARQERCDERALVERLYLDVEGARALVDSGRVEVGGHTVEHPVLSTLPPEGQRREIAGGRERLARALGAAAPLATFAYPYGRSWDFDAASCEAVLSAGFRWAVTTHAGTNTKASDPLRLCRWPIEEHTPLHVLGVEASGGFELLRRRGFDPVE